MGRHKDFNKPPDRVELSTGQMDLYKETPCLLQRIALAEAKE